MLMITVELLPGGDPSRRRTIATMEIANVTGLRDLSDYRGRLHAEYTTPEGRIGYVRQFNRRTQSVWSLIGAFLKLWGHTRHSPTLLAVEKPNTEAQGRPPLVEAVP